MLPAGEEHPCDVGKRQENFPKNRFRTTFPCKNNNKSEIPAINSLAHTIQTELTKCTFYYNSVNI